MKTVDKSKSPLFKGLSEKELEYALEFFSAKEKKFTKGEFLKKAGEPLSFFGFVLEGNIQVYIYDIDGNKIIMNSLVPGEGFGESLNYTGIENGVYISADTDAKVLLLHADRIKMGVGDGIKNSLDCRLSNNFTALLAGRTLMMNRRIQILSKPSIREKFMLYLTVCPKRADGSIEVPLNREDMASYLGVNRSALSRELSRMKEEGIIDFKKNIFWHS